MALDGLSGKVHFHVSIIITEKMPAAWVSHEIKSKV